MNIQTSDDAGLELRSSEDSTLDSDIDWDSDPALILERAEFELGANCFGQPIN